MAFCLPSFGTTYQDAPKPGVTYNELYVYSGSWDVSAGKYEFQEGASFENGGGQAWTLDGASTLSATLSGSLEIWKSEIPINLREKSSAEIGSKNIFIKSAKNGIFVEDSYLTLIASETIHIEINNPNRESNPVLRATSEGLKKEELETPNITLNAKTINIVGSVEASKNAKVQLKTENILEGGITICGYTPLKASYGGGININSSKFIKLIKSEPGELGVVIGEEGGIFDLTSEAIEVQGSISLASGSKFIVRRDSDKFKNPQWIKIIDNPNKWSTGAILCSDGTSSDTSTASIQTNAIIQTGELKEGVFQPYNSYRPYDLEGSSNRFSLVAFQGGEIFLNEPGSTYEVYGTIWASAQSDDEGIDSGKIHVGGKFSKIAGDLIANNKGVVDISLLGETAVWEGKTFVLDGGLINLNLAEGAKWIVRGDSYLTNLKVDGPNSSIDITHPENEGHSTVVIDSFGGNHSLNLLLNAEIKGVGSRANDRIIVRTADQSQTHTLTIPSNGAPGEEGGRSDYLLIVPEEVQVALMSSPNHSFKNPVVDLGNYLYVLDKEESPLPEEFVPETTVANALLKAEGNGNKYTGYFLRPATEEELEPAEPEVPPAPEEPPVPEEPSNPISPETPTNPSQPEATDKPQVPVHTQKPLFSPTAQAVLAMAGMGGQNAMYHNQLSDLRKRLGEVRDRSENGLWTSVSGQRDRFYGFASNGVKQNAYRFNFGYDHKIGDWIVGANFKYLHGTQKTSNGLFPAKGKVNSAGFNLYGTWIGENGGYVDLVASLDHYHQKITTSMLDGRGVKGKVNNLGLGLSAEVGKKFAMPRDTFIEPQVQLSYYRIDGKDFTTSNGMEVKQKDFNGLTGRLGLVAGKDFKNAEGKITGQLNLRGGVKQTLTGKQRISVNSVNFRDDLKGTSGYYGVGFEVRPNSKLSVYGHIERENGKHYTKEIEAMVGLRYNF